MIIPWHEIRSEIRIVAAIILKVVNVMALNQLFSVDFFGSGCTINQLYECHTKRVCEIYNPSRWLFAVHPAVIKTSNGSTESRKVECNTGI